MNKIERFNITPNNPETSEWEKRQEIWVRELLANNPELEKIYRENPPTQELTINESGMIVSEGQTYANIPKMRKLVEIGNAIRASLPNIQEEYTRLWRGNRPGEIGHNPSYTNSLEGIALPFLHRYQGVLSYVDIPQEKIKGYAAAGGAKDSEFILPSDLVKNADLVGFTPEETRELKRNAKPKGTNENMVSDIENWEII